MNLIWVTISNKGGNEERLHFKATAPLQLSYYAILDSVAQSDEVDEKGVPNRIYAGQRTCYWFSPKEINAGDNVVLYTRAGTASTETRPEGVYHFIFRGLAAPLYSGQRASPVLLELTTWQARV